MKSIPRLLLNGVTAAENTLSSVFNPQRIFDELGALQVEVSEDPATGPATADGDVVMEGRLHPSAPWVALPGGTIPYTDFSATVLSKIIVDVPVVPHMRVALRADGIGYSVPGTMTISVWFME